MSRHAWAFNACLGLSSALFGLGEPMLILPLWMGYYIAAEAL
jgi:hypothetical protein